VLPYSSAHYGWPQLSKPAACPNKTTGISFSKHAKSGKHLLICRGYLLDTISQASRPEADITVEHKTREIAFLERAMNHNDDVQVQKRLKVVSEELRILKGRLIPDSDRPVATIVPPCTSGHQYINTDGLKRALDECFRALGVNFEHESSSIFDIPHDLRYGLPEIRIQQIQLNTASFRDEPGLTTFNSVREVLANFNLWGTAFKELFPADMRDMDPYALTLPDIPDRTVTLARLLTTCKGYVGACIGHARPGDQIYLLPGCTMPVILRPSSSCKGAYSLKGGVYVPGVMKGEAFAELQTSNAVAETITIC
jgi:hypothetical protein